MDDLSGLDWNAQHNTNSKSQASNTRSGFSYPSLQPTPSPSNSGRSTPLAFSNLQNTGSSAKVIRPVSKPSTPANDSFANLLNPGANKTSNTLSLQERQRQLQEEKAQQEAERRKKLDAHYGQRHGAFWDGLGQNRTSSPLAGGHAQSNNGLSSTINKPFANIGSLKGTSVPSQEDDDLMAAFDSEAPVDTSSHFPPPRGGGQITPAFSSTVRTDTPPVSTSNNGFDFHDDDDPFGLSQIKPKQPATAPVAAVDDDDFLGLLGKPVEDLPKAAPRAQDRKPRRRTSSPPERTFDQSTHPQAKAVAELVDMGFPEDKSADALARTETGMNVQAAVGILLNQAHEEAKQKAQGRPTNERVTSGGENNRSRRPQREAGPVSSKPAWMQAEEERIRSGSRSKDGQPHGVDKDFAAQAQNIGANLFKSANSLWKTGQKKVQKAVQDFQQEEDSSQPKWMREAQTQETERARKGKAPDPGVTDEAMMLEAGNGPPKRTPKSASNSGTSTPASGQWNDIPDDMFQAPKSRPGIPPKQPSTTTIRSARQLTREDVEQQAGEVFVSSRRRRPQPTAATTSTRSTRDASPITSPPLQSRNPFNPSPKSPTPATVSKPSTPIPTRPKAPPRNIPSVSSLALQSSANQRSKGSEAFKRGDYSSAHTHYTSALQGIPPSYPIAIILYCNRALTNIKVGDPRAAVSDAELALATIGVSRGDGEKISLGGSEGEKDMKEFFGKALMRKAEALEHMEKWNDAAKIWREAVEAGVGGPIAIQGRNRCEKAAGGKPSTKATPAPVRKPAPRKPAPRPSALSDLHGGAAQSTEAVRKLREANAAAEQADDEKFALTDLVDAKLVAWKGTKSDNLRALLGSLDKVLWEEAGWKKVGMQDLVMTNKVKIIYMKAIAKVHPDKIPQSATTEQRMISAAVFATLNEAWDKFKADNNM